MKIVLPILMTATLVVMPVRLTGQVVHTLPAEDLTLEGSPVDLYSIGALDGEPWETLSGVRGVGFDGAGRLHVLDAAARVLVFDSAGIFIREVGRRGRGPGEINLPGTVAVGDDGTVVVVDPGAGYHVFRPDGSYVRTVVPSVPAFRPMAVLFGEFLTLPGGALASRRAGAGLPLVRQSMREGGTTEVIYEGSDPAVETTASPGDDGRMTFTYRRPPAYSPALRIARAEEDRIAVAAGRHWSIDVLSAEGEVVATLDRPFSGRPATAEDREVVERKTREAGGGIASRSFGDDPPAARRSRGGVAIAETIPVIRALRGDGSGVLLVARETNPVAGDEPLIDVVRTGGEYVGTIRGEKLPAALGPGRRAAYVETDELGVERVVVQLLPQSWFGD